MVSVSVIGLGKLGLPLAAVLADSGFHTYGIDLNFDHVTSLQRGLFKSAEPGLERLLIRGKENLNFSSSFEEAAECDVHFLIVPTPSDTTGKFSNQYILEAIDSLLSVWKVLSKPKTLVIVSTVMPGSCVNVFVPKIRNWERENGLTQGTISLVYSPEFIALGTVIENLRNPDMVLVGSENPEDARIFLEVMSRVAPNVRETDVLTLGEAELVKLLVNCFVTMKISFANFIGELSEGSPMIDKFRVAKALGLDSRIGNKYLRPGLGFAGPCFPRDNKALISFSNELGVSPSLAIATEDINSRQPRNVLNRIFKSYPNAKKIGIIGVAYKRDTLVLDESQSLKIADLILLEGGEIWLFDPLIRDFETDRFNIAQKIEELEVCDLVIFPSEFGYLLEGKRKSFPNILEI